MDNGVRYVMWDLINEMLMSYASNLDFQVAIHAATYVDNLNILYGHVGDRDYY